MRFVHLSDLHLGKIVHEFSMLEDQAYILERVADFVEHEGNPKVDAVLISGDIYDRSIAPTEALTLFEHFLRRLVSTGTKVFMISGNHDSPERLAYCSSLMAHSGIYVSRTMGERLGEEKFSIERHILTDEHGEVALYLLPYVSKKMVRAYFPDSDIHTWTDAIETLIRESDIDHTGRTVILAHQYIANAQISDSEEHSVGGLDAVDPRVFEGFDYVALGHLHRPQAIPGHPHIRYSGSPLKYSFSESSHQKSVTVVDLSGRKGEVKISTVPLVPMRDMRVVRGYLDEIVKDEGLKRDDYYRIILEDMQGQAFPFRRLREVYPNMMVLEYAGGMSRETEVFESNTRAKTSPYELFEDFFQMQAGKEMSEEQRKYLQDLMEEVFVEEGV